MQRKCLKCDRINEAATGDAIEACPQCGAIYSRVEAAFATRSKTEHRPATARPSTETMSRYRPQFRGDADDAEDEYVDVYAFAETLRAQSLYPTFRSLVRVIYWFFILLAAASAIVVLVTLFKGSGVGRIGGVIGGVFMTFFFILIARITSETSLMIADLSDAAVRIAAGGKP